MCDEGKEKRERSLDVSLLFFFERISRFGFVGSRQMKKHQFVNQTTLELYLVLIKGVCKILSSEFPEEEKKGNNKRHRKRIEQERDR